MDVSESTFETEVLKSDKPVFVDFGASWCQPCKILAPIFEKLTEELKDEAKLVKVNVDENQQLAQNYGILGLPTIAAFNKGEEIARIMFRNEQQVRDEIKDAIEKAK